MSEAIFKGYPIQKGYGSQRGAGLGGLLSKFMKYIVPIAKNNIVPHIPKLLEDGAKKIGSHIVDISNSHGKELITNLNKISEDNQKIDDESFQLNEKQFLHRGDGYKKKSIKGSRKSKKSIKNSIILKKRNKNDPRIKDIFDNLENAI